MNTNNLRENIKKAFQSIEYPQNDPIVIDPNDMLYYDFLVGLKDKKWQDINKDFVEKQRMETLNLTPRAFVYFLPAFLLAALHEQTEIDVYLITNFIPNEEINNVPEFHKRLDLLNEEQKLVIKDFVRWYLHTDTLFPYKEIARSFWNL